MTRDEVAARLVQADLLEDEGLWEEAAWMRIFDPESTDGNCWVDLGLVQVWAVDPLWHRNRLQVQEGSIFRGFWAWHDQSGWTFHPVVRRPSYRPCPPEIRRAVEEASARVVAALLAGTGPGRP